MQQHLFEPHNHKIFVFDDVYPERAAQEQAEKKKLNAFGLGARLNPLKRPKDETVLLQRHEKRYEPFWVMHATRTIDYTCQVTYPIAVHNLSAYEVQINGVSHPVKPQKTHGKIDCDVIEQCHRVIEYSGIVDGMSRDIREAQLKNYLDKYKYEQRDEFESAQIVKPLIPLTAALQKAAAYLNKEAINASMIQVDDMFFEKMYLYLRPVYAFEFRWTTTDKVGVIEVDGLTGDVIEGGDWFKDKMHKMIARDNLVDMGAEVMNTVVPGGGLVIKLMNTMAD